jgi:hypothetical protein
MSLYLDFYLPDTCSETIATADDNIHGNCNKSSSVTDDVLPCNARSESVQSSILACNGADSDNLEQLKNTEVSKDMRDSQVLEVADTSIDTAGENSSRNAANPIGCKGEVTVLFQDSSAELESNSETLVNPDKPFGPTGNCGAPNNEPVVECKQHDTGLFSDIESSYSHNAVEQENGKSSVSSRTGGVSDSRHGSQASSGSEPSVHLFQELDGDFQGLDDDGEDSEAVLNDKPVNVELRSDETGPSRIDVQMQQDDLLEPSGKSSYVEMGNDQTELSNKIADVGMENKEIEVSSDVSGQAGSNDLDDHTEHVSEDNGCDVTAPGMKQVNLEDKNTEAEKVDKLDEDSGAELSDNFDKGTEAEQGGKFDEGTEVEHGDKLGKDGEAGQGDKLDEDSEVEQDGKLCHMEKGDPEAEVWQAVSNDTEITNVRAVDEGSVLRTKSSSEHSDTVSPEKDPPFIELERTVENGKGNKILTFLCGN